MPTATATLTAAPMETSVRTGRYRLWVQVKCEGRVLTGVFDAEVVEAR